jgi:hypothetical protein
VSRWLDPCGETCLFRGWPAESDAYHSPGGYPADSRRRRARRAPGAANASTAAAGPPCRLAQEALDLADQVVARWQPLLIDHRLQALDVGPRRLLERGRSVEPCPELASFLRKVPGRQRDPEMPPKRLDQRE